MTACAVEGSGEKGVLRDPGSEYVYGEYIINTFYRGLFRAGVKPDI